MSDDKTEDAAPKKKKGKLVKIVGLALGLVVLVGGGVGAGLYAASSGLVGGGGAHAEKAEDPNKPKLVPKSEQKHGEAGKEGGEAKAEGGEGEGASHGGLPVPEGSGGEPYASNYYAMDKSFTANLRESVHFIQVGVAISTPYDDKVIENIKTNDIAIRSAILMTLGDTAEDQVFTSEGKTALQKRLAAVINRTLKEKEGFGGVGNVYFTSFVVQ